MFGAELDFLNSDLVSFLSHCILSFRVVGEGPDPAGKGAQGTTEEGRSRGLQEGPRWAELLSPWQRALGVWRGTQLTPLGDGRIVGFGVLVQQKVVLQREIWELLGGAAAWEEEGRKGISFPGVGLHLSQQ